MRIWYPSPDDAAPFRYNNLWFSGKVSRDGDMDRRAAPFPILLFSHGYMGCATQSSFLVEAWASRGFVVAAPEHNDSFLCGLRGGKKTFQKLDFRKSMLENASERLFDIRACREELIRLNRDPQSIFHGSLDENRIGLSGHSLGGWTSLALSGAVKNAQLPDLKATLLMAPFIKDFSPQDYARMRAPLLYLIGENDQYTLHTLIGFLLHEDRIPRRVAYEQSNPPKFSLILKEANHFSFTNYTCFFYKSVEACRAENPKASAMVRYSNAFWEAYLKEDPQALESLKAEGDPAILSSEWAVS